MNPRMPQAVSRRCVLDKLASESDEALHTLMSSRVPTALRDACVPIAYCIMAYTVSAPSSGQCRISG